MWCEWRYRGSSHAALSHTADVDRFRETFPSRCDKKNAQSRDDLRGLLLLRDDLGGLDLRGGADGGLGGDGEHLNV